MRARGFTLVELLIGMSLSMIIIAALVPVSLISLRSMAQVQGIEKEINQLGQSLALIESDLKSTALTGCALDKKLIVNSLFPDQGEPVWISGYTHNRWFPLRPEFVNTNPAPSFDAIHLVNIDMSNPVSVASLAQTPGRIIFATNCVVSEISRASQSNLIGHAYSNSDLSIFGLQSIQYYVKQNQDKHTLYRQYLTKSGHPRNEPLVDNIEKLKIGYAEVIDEGELAIKAAPDVSYWKNVRAVYVSVILHSAPSKPVSTLVLLDNHAP